MHVGDSDESDISLFEHGIPVARTSSTNSQELTVNLSDSEEYCLDRATIKKIVSCSAVGAIFIASTAAGCLWGQNTKVLDISMFFNGISVTALCILALSSNRAVSEFLVNKSASWSYEFLFFATQIFLNAVPKRHRGIAGSVFSWGYGAMEGKDILNHFTHTQGKLPITNVPSKQSDLLRTLGYTTQDVRWRNGIMGSLFAAGSVLTILNFALFRHKFYGYDDYGKLGVYQDMIAFLTSYSGSNLMTGFLCDKVRALEEEFHDSIVEGKQPSGILKMGNFAKRIAILSAPVIVGVTFAIDTEPNTALDYFSISLVTYLCAQAVFLSAEEFENPKSRIHTISDRANPRLLSFKDSISSWMYKYGTSILFELGLVAFFIWVLVEDPTHWSIAVGVPLIAFVSFILTDILAAHYRPEKDSLALNTVAFHTLYCSMWLAFFYEYITTKMEIDDQNLDPNSKELYIMGHAGWYILAALIGINRATNIQNKSYSMLETNPAFFTQEMSKFFIDRISV